jgi:hypothetical protein
MADVEDGADGSGVVAHGSVSLLLARTWNALRKLLCCCYII